MTILMLLPSTTTGITLRESLHNYNVPQLSSGNTSCFLMSWVGQYSLSRNGTEVCAFKNQKQQSIEGADELSYSVIQR
ncbi:5508_t:CDS:2 [Diversispora eburnea]|uniref:5508_t:CDS:1 n=1 Tax=Diversispora eburnea TaxID=1213867 RepID=A0A9N9AWM6_9GLOM|nr:5508_t:CDS:2 [Diversispora eburnea]